MAENGSTALIYVRKSIVRTRADEISPERQQKACISQAEGRDWQYEVYADAEGHRSGRSERHRPAWRDLKSQLPRPDVTAVIVYSLDRAARNLRYFLDFLDECEAHEVTVVSCKENLDTSSAVGRAIVAILMTLYTLEADLASERMTESIEYKRRELGQHWGLAPFGCERDEKKILIPSSEGYWYLPVSGAIIVGDRGHCPIAGDHAEWRGYHKALQEMYTLYLSGDYSYDGLAHALNEEGWRFRSRHGLPRPMRGHDIRRTLLAWPLYKGDLPLGRAKDKPTIIVDGAHDPILDPELCERVGQILVMRERKYGFKPMNAKRFYLLSDVLYCADCAKPLQGSFDHNKRRYRHRVKGECKSERGWYICEDLDEQVLNALKELRLSDDLKEQIREEGQRLLQEWQGQDAQARAVWKEIRQIDKKIARLTELYLEGDITKKEYRSRKAALSKELELATDRLPDTSPGPFDMNEILEKIERVGDLIDRAEPAQQKTLVNALFERLEVKDGVIVKMVPRAWARPFF